VDLAIRWTSQHYWTEVSGRINQKHPQPFCSSSTKIPLGSLAGINVNSTSSNSSNRAGVDIREVTLVILDQLENLPQINFPIGTMTDEALFFRE